MIRIISAKIKCGTVTLKTFLILIVRQNLSLSIYLYLYLCLYFYFSLSSFKKYGYICQKRGNSWCVGIRSPNIILSKIKVVIIIIAIEIVIVVVIVVVILVLFFFIIVITIVALFFPSAPEKNIINTIS